MPHAVRLASLVVLLTVFSFSADVAKAQFTGLETGGVSYFTFARPGENTIQVLVIGDTRDGIYEIGEGTNLAEFVALSGGAGEGPLQAGSPLDAREIRRVTIRLFRKDEDGQRRIVYEAPIEDLVEIRTAYPELRHEDVLRVEIERRRPFGWRDALTIVGAASSIIILIDRITRITN